MVQLLEEGLGDAELQILHTIACAGIRKAVNDPGLVHRLPYYSNVALLRDIAGMEVDSLPAPLLKLTGVFVTIKKRHHTGKDELRGCKGCIVPSEPLYCCAISSAIKSAVHDTRFDPVTSAELEDLTVGVSALTAPEPIASWEDYEVGRHGIILAKGEHKAVFLPEVPIEHGYNAKQTLSKLAMKAGLEPNAWRRGCKYTVFLTSKLTKDFC
jgi:AmmeMemoRadiSam system protein A|mmetsp:Transcript_12325/g.18953  ORF Transcript_12325/g.18953 Transcript_12325/m.18953 type:complete len:212 (-) Transcript_12325:1039-1674(-)